MGHTEAISYAQSGKLSAGGTDFRAASVDQSLCAPCVVARHRAAVLPVDTEPVRKKIAVDCHLSVERERKVRIVHPMNWQPFFVGAFLVAAALPAGAQTVVPPGRPAGEILDSLHAGHARWVRARVDEYQLQSHVDCFCIYTREAFNKQRSLLTIRHGAIVARSKGKPDTTPSRDDVTIDDLFTSIEQDARSSERIIDTLALHPIYGFPVLYKAHGAELPDDWLAIQVDSFAVVRRHQ